MTSKLSYASHSLRRLSTPTRLGHRSFSLIESLRRNAPIDILPEVADALATNKPVVALESAIITNGMPYPTNLETSLSVERVVRSTGSIPATIAMLDGRIKIGLEDAQVRHLAEAASTVKISRRDIAPAIAQRMDGGTTCSATLIFAALAGIKVFATGGLGGVHRGGENSMDVSADLNELTRCPVGLVSAGVKSILDIGRTLEYLETLGVPVMSYAKTNDFPAFFTVRSGFKTPWRVDDPATAAGILFAQWQLGMNNGALFGVPIPEKYEAVGKKLQEAVEVALAEAEQNGVSKRGKEATPWLLQRVTELTAGTSLTSNVALIENTALVGGQIAVEYAKLVASQTDNCENSKLHYCGGTQPSITTSTNPPATVATATKDNPILPLAGLVVVGCAAMDISASPFVHSSLDSQSTSPGSVQMTLGGVARNVAEAAHRLLIAQSGSIPNAAMLVSPIGDDAFGRVILEETKQIGMRTDGLLQTRGARSAVCNMLLNSTGNLTGGIADMDIIKNFDPKRIVEALKQHQPHIVALDGNLSEEALKSITAHCNENSVNVLFEPTSIIKSTAILPAVASCLEIAGPNRSPVAYATPNLLELAQMYHVAQAEPLDLTSHPAWWKTIDNFAISHQFRMELEQLARRNVSDVDASKGTLSFLVENGTAQMAINLLPFFQNMVIKCGERGLLVILRVSDPSKWSREYSNIHRRRIVAHGKTAQDIVVLQHIPALPLPKESIRNVTGAGDTLVGSLLASLLRDQDLFCHPELMTNAMQAAQAAAVATLQSHKAVSPLLSLPAAPLASL